MKILDIVRYAATYLKRNDVLDLPELGGSTVSEGGQEALELLVRCANLAIREIAAEYIPLVDVQRVAASPTVNYSLLNNRVMSVLGVTDQHGGKKRFKALPSELEVTLSGGEVTLDVRFTYMPSDVALGGDSQYAGRVSPHTAAYGAAAEYCLINGLYDEAAMWDNRFRTGLVTAAGSRSEMRLARRRWL